MMKDAHLSGEDAEYVEPEDPENPYADGLNSTWSKHILDQVKNRVNTVKTTISNHLHEIEAERKAAISQAKLKVAQTVFFDKYFVFEFYN